MNTFRDLEHIGEQFKQADDIEIESQFVKGRVIVAAAEQGWNIDEVAGYCANMTGHTKRTCYRYYSTVRTFPQRMYDHGFEMHAIAAATIDYRKAMSADELAKAQDAALEWLKVAKREGYSTRALTAAIKASGGRVEERPTVLLDGKDGSIASIMNTQLGTIVTLFFADEEISLPYEKVKVTLVQATAQASV